MIAVQAVRLDLSVSRSALCDAFYVPGHAWTRTKRVVVTCAHSPATPLHRETLTSTANPWVKHAVRLRTSRAARECVLRGVVGLG
jgi:hypothetical protein